MVLSSNSDVIASVFVLFSSVSTISRDESSLSILTIEDGKYEMVGGLRNELLRNIQQIGLPGAEQLIMGKMDINTFVAVCMMTVHSVN